LLEAQASGLARDWLVSGAEFQTEKLVFLLNQMRVGKFFLGQILNA
jgi:hypothetical protein